MSTFSELDSLTDTLLASRGIVAEGEREAFLSPNYELHTHDPFLLPNMTRAVERIERAIANDERIAIWSDYDTDGIPGAVVLADFFKKIGYTNVRHYIPHRILEGFGLNVEGVDVLKEDGVSLIISIDCGITDVEPVARANEEGMDVIITDHHLPGPVLPAAYAIVNPKMPGNEYPFDMLCGAAVAWKLVSALASKRDDIPTGWEKWLLDMVGIATLSDMVPLVGENRVLAKYGLVVLRKSRRPGVQKLCKKLRMRQSYLTEDDVGFMIAPRINAASRMGVPEDALNLLSTTDEVEAGMLTDHLDKINNERKGHVAAMVKEAKGKLSEREAIPPVIVMGNPKWKPSLLGLVANTLMNEYRRPVFMWGREDGTVIKGSCRSPGPVSVVALMHETRDTFIDAGGHAFSGGFSLENENIFTLEDALLGAYEKIGSVPVDEVVQVATPIELPLAAVNATLLKKLAVFAPFGEGNPKPQFIFRGCTVAKMKQFGKASEHLSLTLAQDGNTREAIAFFSTPTSYQVEPREDRAVSVMGTVEQSFFGGSSSIRVRIEDIR